MPTLPTFTVTDAQAQRMLAAWGSVSEYRRWLREQIAMYVSTHEANQTRQQNKADLEAQLVEDPPV